MRTLCVLGCLLLATPAWSQARGPSTQTIRYARRVVFGFDAALQVVISANKAGALEGG